MDINCPSFYTGFVVVGAGVVVVGLKVLIDRDHKLAEIILKIELFKLHICS